MSLGKTQSNSVGGAVIPKNLNHIAQRDTRSGKNLQEPHNLNQPRILPVPLTDDNLSVQQQTISSVIKFKGRNFTNSQMTKMININPNFVFRTFILFMTYTPFLGSNNTFKSKKTNVASRTMFVPCTR
ncbi:hypothetical protein MHYP_G00147750 [Metynnis hypsauchen]